MRGSGHNCPIFAEPAPVVGFRRFKGKEGFLPPASWGTYGLVSRCHSAEYYGPSVRRLIDNFGFRSSQRDAAHECHVTGDSPIGAPSWPPAVSRSYRGRLGCGVLDRKWFHSDVGGERNGHHYGHHCREHPQKLAGGTKL